MATATCWADVTSVSGLAGWLAWVGRLTGLLAGYACAVLLGLVSRIPALDRGVGTDRLARWHATVGRFTIVLSVTHMLFATAAHVARSGTGALEATVGLILDGPAILEATVGLLLLVGVAIVSVRQVRRRMRYETWHYLHFVTYGAVFLAFAHQLTGPDFVDSLVMSALWQALYVSVPALLIWYRFLTLFAAPCAIGCGSPRSAGSRPPWCRST
ncbi:ferric reductase-like transmembrane domain-containing protein [Streptosporangium lutulentum]